MRVILTWLRVQSMELVQLGFKSHIRHFPAMRAGTRDFLSECYFYLWKMVRMFASSQWCGVDSLSSYLYQPGRITITRNNSDNCLPGAKCCPMSSPQSSSFNMKDSIYGALSLRAQFTNYRSRTNDLLA